MHAKLKSEVQILVIYFPLRMEVDELDLDEALKGRRSIRSFLSKEVSESLIR